MISFECLHGRGYRLTRAYRCKTSVVGAWAEVKGRCVLLPDGALYVCAGYTWDGPSGPALDTASFLRASLVHDALYELMRRGGLPLTKRAAADREMRYIAAEDGMPWYRRWWTYWAVRLFAGPAAR